MGELIEIYRVFCGLDEIKWINYSVFSLEIDLIGPALDVRCNQTRLRRKTFKASLKNSYS